MPKPLANGLDYASRAGALKRARSRRAVRRLTAHASEGALNRLERVTLGGATQTLLTRSSGQDQGVALYIHGFLDPALAAARRVGWASGLEDQFTVVYWERRGYASAYRRGLDASTMTVDQATDDAVELIDMLVARHDRPIHLIGHSLGSVVALSAAAARPQAVASVTVLAPVIDNQAGDSIVWERVQRGVASAPGLLLRWQLKRLGPPPYPARKALLRLSLISRTGGLYRDRYAGLGRLILDSTFASWRTPEYTLVDLVRAAAMIRFIVRSSWADVMSLRMDERVRSLPMPVLMVLGRSDNGTPPELAVDYFQRLHAPAGKQLRWLEDSAHFCHVEQPARLGWYISTHIRSATADPAGGCAQQRPGSVPRLTAGRHLQGRGAELARHWLRICHPHARARHKT